MFNKFRYAFVILGKYFISVLAVFLTIVVFIAIIYGVLALLVHGYECVGFNHGDAVNLSAITGTVLFIALILGFVVNEFW